MIQIWVRFYDLPEELFDKSVIWELARCVRTLVRIHPHSLEGEYAHFVRVLVKLDVSTHSEREVGIEFNNSTIKLSVTREQLSEYCHTCKALGHYKGSCKKF